MNAPAALIAHSFRRVRTVVVVLALVLAALQVLLVVLAEAVSRTTSMEALGSLLPPFVREFFGSSLTSFLSFKGMICQGYFHPMVIGSLVALAIVLATMTVSELETGFLDFILSRPIGRHWLITRSIVVLATSVAAVLCAMMLGTWIGLQLFGPKLSVWPAPSLIISMGLNIAFLSLAWGGVAMAVGVASSRRAVAGGITGLLALVMFFLDYAARAWAPLRSCVWISLFHYYDPLDLITGVPLRVWNLIVLGSIAVIGYLLAYYLFQRRDLTH